MTDKKRGGWSNPASANNGKSGGRPRAYARFARGEALILERQTIGGADPFRAPERGVVLSVSADEIEIQIGDDILVLRRPE